MQKIYLEPDKLINNNRWKIIKALDEGGMGQVYKAFDHNIQQEVALKFVAKENFAWEFRGFQVLYKVIHRNVVRVFNVEKYSEDDNFVFIENELVQGETLAKIISRRLLTLDEINSIMQHLFDGLVEIEKVAWHRDIKPQNIMLVDGRPDTLKILDLGLARVKTFPVTHSFSQCGTPGYTPPEVWKGEGDETCDVFMTGITYFELLTQTLPYGTRMYDEIDRAKLEIEAFKRLRGSRLKPPRYIIEIIEKAISLDSQKRYSSVNEFYDAFKQAQSKYGKHKDAINFHDPRLRTFYDLFESQLFSNDIEIDSCKDIEFGIQFEAYKDFVKCKLCVYSGKNGFKIVPIPPKNINELALLKQVIHEACTILKLESPVVNLIPQPNSIVIENLNSNIKEIEILLSSRQKLFDENCIKVIRQKELNYGTQFNVNLDGEEFILNIYYSSKKGFSFVFGGNLDEDKKRKILVLLSSQEKLENDLVIVPYSKWVGSDESGKGDYFGPLVSAAFLVSRDIEKELLSLGVRDSKTISEAKIEEIARILHTDYRERIAICELPPNKYNDFVEKMKLQGKGLNTVLAWCHAVVIQDLAEKNDFEAAIADQFGDESYIRLEIAKNPKMKDARGIELLQQPKAEKNVAVAAASILARDRFSRRIRELSEKYKMEIPKGAGPDANKIAKNLVELFGREELSQIVKLHFKNTKDILEG